MLWRALFGLGKGGLIGALVAVALVYGLGLTTFGSPWLALPAAALAGAMTGLVAGRPIWAPGARIEAWLKAVAGAVLAAGLLFLLRRYVGLELTLPAALGAGTLGDLPLLALPAVAAVLGLLFEVDHTGDGDTSEPARSRVGPGPDRSRVQSGPAAAAEQLEEGAQQDSRAERRRR